MRSETLVAVFSPDFAEDDILVHTDLCREYSADLEVHAHVLRDAADVDRIACRYRGIGAFSVWNLYMEVDEVSFQLLAAFGSRLAGSNHTITAKTVRKSAMNEVFDKTEINKLWSITIEDSAAVDRLEALPEIPFPVIVKVDQGYNIYPIDVNAMCSVWPASQFEVSLAGDGASRKDLIGWMLKSDEHAR